MTIMPLEINSNKCLIVTSINGFDHLGVTRLIKHSQEFGINLIVIGDRKTPEWPNLEANNVRFVSIDDQKKLGFESSSVIGENHYGRKIIGYLIAASEGRTWISETDDDNIPYSNFWDIPLTARDVSHTNEGPWVNFYTLFGYPDLWHRGIPIDKVLAAKDVTLGNSHPLRKIGVIQGLADGDPDIDAIGRMLYAPVTKFNKGVAYRLGTKSLSPTNSQLTHWDAKLLPLMYLPHTVSWRVADIWRGLIAQIWMNSNGWESVYVGAVGFQDRNEHDLQVDFADEISLHLSTHLVINCVKSFCNLEIFQFMEKAYLELLGAGLVSLDDVIGVRAYLRDCLKITNA